MPRIANETSSSGSSGRSDPGIDLARALTFFFEDPNWVSKLLVGSLFALLTPFLIGTVFLAGYAILVAKHTKNRLEPALPEWDDLAGIFIDGLKAVAISLAHQLPLIIMSVLMMLALIGSAVLQRGSESLPEELVYFGIPAIFGGWLLIFVLSLAVFAYAPAAFVRFVQTDDLGAAFAVGDNIAFIRRHASSYGIALLAILLAAIIGQFGIILFCIGVFPAMFWSSCVMGYAIGELARLDGTPPAAALS